MAKSIVAYHREHGRTAENESMVDRGGKGVMVTVTQRVAVSDAFLGDYISDLRGAVRTAKGNMEKAARQMSDSVGSKVKLEDGETVKVDTESGKSTRVKVTFNLSGEADAAAIRKAIPAWL